MSELRTLYVHDGEQREQSDSNGLREAMEWGMRPVTVDDVPPEAIKRAARAWAETIVGGAEIDQLAVDPLATKQALKILRAALGGTK